ncbi:MAG: hypothetical protein ACJ789_17035 [Thermomicrobiales bacterium]
MPVATAAAAALMATDPGAITRGQALGSLTEQVRHVILGIAA